MHNWTEDLIDIDAVKTLDRLFVERVRRSPDKTAYQQYDKHDKSWITLNWGEMGDLVGRWQVALAKEGLSPGDRVAILLRNCWEWVAFDQAALGLGLVTVPLYTDDRPDNVAYILEDAGVRLMLVQDAGRWRRLSSALTDNQHLKRVVIMDGGRSDLPDDDPRAVASVDWLPAHGELIHRAGEAETLASIVYTSGTTGRPKGVMLSHYNMMSIAHAALVAVDCYEQDVFLSFLPLSHTLERTAGYYLPMMAGAELAYSRSIAQLGEDLCVVRPTVLIAVPRIFERVYGRIQDQMKHKSGFARGLFSAAVRVGWKRFEHSQGRASWRPSLLLWPILKALVASKITAKLGGRLRITVSGGAALSPEIAQIFIGLGIPLLQGYGLTETSPVLAVNTLAHNVPASVGLALLGVQAKVGVNDELIVKSPGIMLGYWNNHVATAEMIDSDGWLHTGDQARIEDGHIFITGRLKDILVLSNGEKVPPSDMEMAIALNSAIEQILVVGEGQSFLTALIVLDGEQWPALAQSLSLDPMSEDSLSSKVLVKEILLRVKQGLKDFPGYAKIRKVHLTLEPWSVDNGLATPTMKVKRVKVLERYAAEVEKLYQSK